MSPRRRERTPEEKAAELERLQAPWRGTYEEWCTPPQLKGISGVRAIKDKVFRDDEDGQP